MSTRGNLAELAKERRQYVEVARANRFEDGLRALLSDLYPDNAHFIYELLQNAEDAGARSVDFDLGRSRLIFTHDGLRQFSLEDIESITGIGQSTKKSDVTQIGKFGVGFKSVFAYTSAPEIRSGEHSFVIEDMFVPEPIVGSAPEGKTVFTFPFNRREKPRAVAFEEVSRSLQELSDTALLFLANIETIRFRTADGVTGRISRTTVDGRYVTITIVEGGEKRQSHWLLLRGGPELSGAIPPRQWVAAAFALDAPPNRRVRAKGVPRAHVVPIANAQTCIYFPASKESSGLRFHVHAPFASTVARDSVRDVPGNDALFEALGQLLARELPGLTEDGLMDDGLLAALPNSADGLSEAYERIRAHIVEAFNTQPITPVLGGQKFAPAESLIAAPSELRSGLSLSDVIDLAPLAGLSAPPAPDWVMSKDGRARLLLSDLDSFAFGWREFGRALSALSEYTYPPALQDARVKSWSALLRRKSDDELLRFHIAIGRGIVDGQLTSISLTSIYLPEVPLFRVLRSGKRQIAAGAEAYLPLVRGQEVFENAIPDTLSVFHDDEATPTKLALEKLFQTAGVTRWDDREQFRSRLEQYDAEEVSNKRHVQDVREFVEYWKQNPHASGIFANSRFIRAETEGGASIVVSPRRAYLDKPYQDTGLSFLYKDADQLFKISGAYARIPDFTAFARSVGVTEGLALSSVNLLLNPEVEWTWRYSGRESSRAKLQDWDLPEFDKVATSTSRALRRTMWDLLCGLSAEYAIATFQLNASSSAHVVRTRIAQRISDSKWVLTRTGKLKALKSVAERDLPPGWPVPKPGSLLFRLGFGEQDRARSEAERDQRRALSSLGFDSGTIESLLEISKAERNSIVASAIEQRRQKASFPGKASANPERRASLVAEDATDARVYETVLKRRTVVKGESELKNSARDYLRRQYSREDGEMHCQACQLEMPFKVDGRPYFEAVQFLPHLLRQHKENYLALCPLCAAMYLYVRSTEDDELMRQLSEKSVEDDTQIVNLTVVLNGNDLDLAFTAIHAVDARAVLQAAGARR